MLKGFWLNFFMVPLLACGCYLAVVGAAIDIEEEFVETNCPNVWSNTNPPIVLNCGTNTCHSSQPACGKNGLDLCSCYKP